jgi:hypothetical protein
MFKRSSLGLCAIALAGMVAAPGCARTVAPGAVKMDKERNVVTVPSDVADGLEDKIGEEPGRNRELVIAPLPSRTPLLGWTLTVPAMFIYKPSSAHEDDQTWVTGVMGFYTENGSWGAGAFHKMSIGADKWRLRGGAATAEVSYDYFGIGGDPDTSIELDQPISLVLLEGLRRVHDNTYVGLSGVYSDSEVRIDVPLDQIPPGLDPPDVSRDFKVVTLAPRFQYDTRNNEFYPTTGALIDGTISIARESYGSDDDFEKYKLEFNSYHEQLEDGTLAVRAAAQHTAGDAPFFVFPAFGSESDLRGYEPGSYRDRFLFATQAEYRHRFTPRMGAVGFAGVGTVDEDLGHWGPTLWSVGAGFRWLIAPKNDMNLRVDVARGRDDTQYYVSIGEAF